MALPKQVQRMGERSDALLAQLHNPNPPPPGDDPSAQPPPSADDAASAAKRIEELTARAEVAEHRRDVMLGKYNGEVPKLHERIRSLEAQIADLNARLSAAPTPGNPAPDLSHLDQEFVKDTRSIVGAELAELRAEVAQLRTGVKAQTERETQDREAEAQRNAQNAMLDRLDKLVPEWKAINESPLFLRWLIQPDKITGVIPQEAFTAADNANDAAGIAIVMNTFVAETGFAAGKPAAPIPANREVPAPAARPAPGGDAPKGKTYTKAEVQKFYTEWAVDGRKRNDPKMREIDADIQLAMREGRIAG